MFLHLLRLQYLFVLFTINSIIAVEAFAVPFYYGQHYGRCQRDWLDRRNGNKRRLIIDHGIPSPIINCSFPAHQLQSKKRENSEDTKDGNNNDVGGNFSRRLERVDQLEIRLDATILAIYVLGRFFIYDVTTGIKQTPGWELHDVIMILQTFSSAIVLACLWTLVGVFVSDIFRYNVDVEDTRNNEVELKRILTTTIISAPAWIFIEILLGWPTSGVLWSQRTGGSSWLDLAGIYLGSPTELISYLFTLVGTGTLGVACTMALGRYVRKYIT